MWAKWLSQSAGVTNEMDNTTEESGNPEKKEVQKEEPSFGKLEKDYESNEWIQDILNAIWSNIEAKLDKSFPQVEKDLIKLTLLNEILNNFNINSVATDIFNKFLGPLKKLLQDWNADESLGEKIEGTVSEITNLPKEFSKFVDNLGLESKLKDIDEKIEVINKNKKDSPAQIFWKTPIPWIIDSTEINKISKETMFINVKQKLDLLSKKIIDWKEVWDDIIAWIEEVPFWEDLIFWFKNLAKDNKFFSFILWLIFWKEFLDEGANKIKKSTKNLKNYVEDDSFPLKENIKKKDVEKLESKKLEKFYKFLEGRVWKDRKSKIDYTVDDFWKELLTWDSKNAQIKELHTLLKWPNKQILDTNEWIEELVKKLNWLEKVEEKQMRIQSDLEKKAAEERMNERREKRKIDRTKNKKDTDINKTKKGVSTPYVPISTIQYAEKENIETKNSIDTKQIAATSVQVLENNINEEDKKDQAIIDTIDFENSIKDITKLPTEILYKGKKVTIDIVDNKIVLWKKSYKIGVMKDGEDLFKKINFSDGILKITGGKWLISKTKEIAKSDLVTVLTGLLEENKYIKKMEWGINIDIKKV